jgi:hypothetical protein
MEKKFAENDFVQIWNEEEILFWEFKPDTIINVLATKEILDLMRFFCQRNQYLVFQDMTNLKWIDKRSRDLFAADKTINNMIAWAYFSEQPLHKVVYSIYATFSKPTVTTNFFDQKENGMNWLKNINT